MKAKGPTLRTLGEFGLLRRLRARTPPLPPDVLLGIGDDASIMQPSPGVALVATVDVLVEGKDFRWEWCSPEAVGQKGLTVSLSDVGAMGAVPKYALVALGLPPGMPLDRVDGLYRGIWKAAEGAGVAVVGGDLSAAPCLMLSVTLIGEGKPDRLLRRNGSKPGETIWVTGSLGRAAAGLSALKAGYRLEQKTVKGRGGRAMSPEIRGAVRQAIRAQLYPVARYREGRLLAEQGVATAMIDLSDGLASDLHRLAEEGKVGFRILAEEIPIDPATRHVARLLGLDPLKLAIAGGEDFELLFTSGADRATIQESLAARGLARPHLIGEVLPEARGVCLVGPRGRPHRLPGGFDHFR
ncbi:MAG: thiamine-phosphate kinase [Candidatus Methylomirabilales bacterium]